MFHFTRLRRMAAVSIACTASLLLTGCFFTPGKFVSQLEIARDGSFAFSYDGQIHMLAMDKLSEMEGKAAFKPFCVDEETYLERECTEAETAEQRANWDKQTDQRAAKDDKDAAMAAAMLGGLDPKNPEAIEEFMATLRRQKGWRKVEHLGDGLFDVSFAISGRLDHDFAFPTFEQVPFANWFVMVALRQDGTVRIDAPAFGGQGGSNPMQAMMAEMGKGLPGGAGKKDMPNLPQLDGTFTIVTDGEVLANNTDTGPVAGPDGRPALVWTVNSRTTAAPTALVRIAQ